MTRTRERKSVRSARRRAAFHAAKFAAARTPYERYLAAENALTSAIKHAPRAEKVARQMHEVLAEQVRAALDQAAPSPASRALYEDRLNQSGEPMQRLGVVLTCLKGVLKRLPDTERDQMHEHYARHMTEQASRIAANGGEL